MVIVIVFSLTWLLPGMNSWNQKHSNFVVHYSIPLIIYFNLCQINYNEVLIPSQIWKFLFDLHHIHLAANRIWTYTVAQVHLIGVMGMCCILAL